MTFLAEHLVRTIDQERIHEIGVDFGDSERGRLPTLRRHQFVCRAADCRVANDGTDADNSRGRILDRVFHSRDGKYGTDTRHRIAWTNDNPACISYGLHDTRR